MKLFFITYFNFGKKLVAAGVLMLTITILCSAPQQAKSQAAVSFQVFYDGLSPYGYWIDYPPYGYVWVPTAYGFVPYATDGYWVYTDEGWVWVSYYPWGWAPFHYGCWDYDAAFGWFWIPGDVWGPAWVTWAYCDGYYGWAPLGPGVAIGYAAIPAARWTFVGARYIADSHVYRYFAPRSSNATYIHRSTVINRTLSNNNTHTTYVAGPSPEQAEKYTGHAITPVSLATASRPGESMSGSKLSIYRPVVSKTTAADPKPVPKRVSSTKNLPHNGVRRRTTVVSHAAPARAPNHPAAAAHHASTPHHTQANPSVHHTIVHKQAVRASPPVRQAPSREVMPMRTPAMPHTVPMQGGRDDGKK